MAMTTEQMIEEIKGMSVMDLAALVKALEEEFGVEVPEEELEGVTTVGHAFDLVVGKL